MKNNFQLIVLLLVALAMFGLTLFWFRPVPDKLTRVTVAGEAETKVQPDTAQITFSVVTQNSQALQAQQENARKSEAVKTAVTSLTANAKPEIKTADYSLQPEQDYGGKMPKIVGYTARNSVTVSIADLTQVGAIIDAATKAGANSVEGVQFVLREDSPAHGAALAMASKQALAKAESIADSLNGRIVRVVETHEAGVTPYQPQPEANDYKSMPNAASMMTARKSAPSTPVQAGSLEVRSEVVLTVEIDVRNLSERK